MSRRASHTHKGHRPYARFEYARRPEYARLGASDTRGFFRYDHNDEPLGSTRWLIASAGYGHNLTPLPYSVRPYLEVQRNRVFDDHCRVEPASLYGRSNFITVSAGFRLFLGGEPMRMGAYGILDSATSMHRMQMTPATEHHH